MAVIETHGLTKYYGKARGVIDLGLEVREGEVFGFLGPNGAGKTTTIRLLLDMIHPTRGDARVFGLDVHADSTAIKARIGNLPGELALYDKLTGKQTLRYLAGLRGLQDLSLAWTLAERLNVDLSRRVGALSHGNHQKIGLIQALMHRPPLVILDEPTLGLDPLVQQEFYKLIQEIKAEGRTVFFSSHVLPEVERVCDRVGMIREGRLAAVEEIGVLKAKAVRHMEISFDTEVPLEDFRLPGIENLVQENHSIRFTVHGPLDPVIKAAARHTVIDLRYQQASLEDIFLAYYSEEGKNVR
jgi:ABC-2 type transport system ATP-binding protein